MSGCHTPYVLGNVAFNNYAHTPLPNSSYMCNCPCHHVTWMGVGVPTCWCKCTKTTTLKIIADNEKIAEIEKRLDSLEHWKNTAKILCDQSKKPHECPVCKGMCKFSVFGKDIEAACPACEGKGVVWG